jgi:tRNA 2-thiouridine synthesizing protein E
MSLYLDEAERHAGPGLAELSEKLDRIQTAVEALDRRREELEDLVTDLLPAVNGMILQVTHRLDALEKSGVLTLMRETTEALQTAAAEIDPADVRALGSGAGNGMRALLALMEPEVAAVAERAVSGIRNARTGRPPGFRQLLRSAREPRVRRGMGALFEVLRALGEGVSSAAVRSAPRRVRPARASSPAPAAAAPSPNGSSRNGASRPATPAASPPSPGGVVELAGRPVHVDGEGFLVEREAWSREVAEALAHQAGIGELTDAHWKVIDFCREDAGETGAAPGLRRITQKLGTPPKELYALFPKGPGILAARLAGLGKPRSCV